MCKRGHTAACGRELEKLPGDGQWPDKPLTRAVSACCQAWIEVKNGYHCSACGKPCEKVAPVVRDTELELGRLQETT